MAQCGCGKLRLVGSNPTLAMSFTDDDGAATNPTGLTVKLLFPDGTTVESFTEASPEVSNPGVGEWEWQRATAPDQVGEYWVYVAASGGGTDIAKQASFSLADTHVPLP